MTDMLDLMVPRLQRVRALDQTTADAITDSIKEILTANWLPVESMVGLATDRANVMTGVNKGVATQ